MTTSCSFCVERLNNTITTKQKLPVFVLASYYNKKAASLAGFRYIPGMSDIWHENTLYPYFLR